MALERKEGPRGDGPHSAQGATFEPGSWVSPPRGAPQDSGRSSRELVGELVDNGRQLLEDQLELAKMDLREEARRAGKVARDVGTGGVVLHTAGLVLVAAVVLLLGLVMPYWLSALIVGVVLGAIGGALLLAAKKRAERLDPRRTDTAKELEEDQRWLKEMKRDVASSRHASA